MDQNKKPTTSKDCEQWFTLSLQEITHTFGVTRATIIEIVEEGIVSMPELKPEKWQFDNDAFSRIRKTLHLHRDLGINLAGAALVLELMQEIEQLRGMSTFNRDDDEFN